MSSILITGANRGIGLELARSFAGLNWKVIACCRSPIKATDLQRLAADRKTVSVQQLDVTNHEQIMTLAGVLSSVPIDILFNNAGRLGPVGQGFGETDEAEWLKTFQVNTIAPLKMAEAFADHVAASERRIIASMGVSWGALLRTHPEVITPIAPPRQQCTWSHGVWRWILRTRILSPSFSTLAGFAPAWGG